MWITWIFDICFPDKYALKKAFVDKKIWNFQQYDENEEIQKTGLKSGFSDGIIASIRTGFESEKRFRQRAGRRGE